MRRLFISSIVLICIGGTAFVVWLVMFILVAGVPYHDGPYAGHIHPPGVSQWVEEVALVPLFLGVVLTGLMGLSGLLLYAVFRALGADGGARIKR